MIIGITGGIGSGKSTICKKYEQQGYRIYDCDKEAKRIIVSNPQVRARIIALLGEDVYEGDTYRTDLVAQRVFADKQKLKALNEIVHPAVREDIIVKNAECKVQSEGLVVESAILMSSGLGDLCDKVVLVTASEETRIARVMARDGATEEQVRARIRAQILPTEDEVDEVVINE